MGDRSLRRSGFLNRSADVGTAPRTRHLGPGVVPLGLFRLKGMIMPPREEVVRSGPWSALFPSPGRGQPPGIALMLRVEFAHGSGSYMCDRSYRHPQTWSKQGPCRPTGVSEQSGQASRGCTAVNEDAERPQ
jgi:hypothetical protein